MREIPKDDVERIREILESSLTEAFVVTVPGTPTRGIVAAGIGHDWLAAKKDAELRAAAAWQLFWPRSPLKGYYPEPARNLVASGTPLPVEMHVEP